MAVGEAPGAELAVVFRQLGPHAEEAVMTTGESIKALGRTEALIELMTAKFGPLPAATIHRVESADPAQVRAWNIRVLTANTPDELLD